MKIDSIILGGGCFWCLDALYKRVEGITKITSGYTGGENANTNSIKTAPTYESVCTGTTGHAEVVKLDFDPQVVSLEVLLRIFFEIHDPTTLNQQGGDVGTQYRSAIFYKDENQKLLAEKVRSETQLNWKDPIVTQIAPLEHFYEAEEYHQDYYAKNPNQPYCVAVISPKLEKFLKH
ncbi:MAG: peptide-methionine (S)-S-oxide reductase MsrA [Candidatus Pacebacteria bacterium]|nr:peptide-methionine (S)-S-oxide reductase MsrA [Candidatus Paceibacterota bacterium]MBP9851864.1 peptide-methionine (S)-S-oxide reductase MsrA [Candidatus Paceibacterota bacterium]